MAVVPVTIGNTSIDRALTGPSVSGTGPWTVTLTADAPSGVLIGDHAVDSISGLYLISDISEDRQTLILIEHAVASNPTDSGDWGSNRVYSNVTAAHSDVANINSISAGDTLKLFLTNDNDIEDPFVSWTINLGLGTNGTIIITSPEGQWHKGVVGIGARWLFTDNNAASPFKIDIGDGTPKMIVENLRVRLPEYVGGGTINGIDFKSCASGSAFRNMIYEECFTKDRNINLVTLAKNKFIKVDNVLSYGHHASGTGKIVTFKAADADIQNCTISDGYLGINSIDASNQCLIKNVVCVNQTSAAFGGTSYSTDSINNASYDGTAPGSGAISGITVIDQFQDPSSGVWDFNVKDKHADIFNAGVDLSSIFTTDIADFTRATPWCIGAYELESVSDTITLFTFNSETIASGLNLFVAGAIPIPSGLELFSTGQDTASSGTDLMVAGHLVSSDNLALVMPDTNGIVDSSITLFMGTFDTITDDLDLVMSASQTSTSDIDLFTKGTTGPYVERIEQWSPITSGVWETKDLSVSPFNIPASAVLEIAISNSTNGLTDPAYSGGVRAVGSVINRTIDIHPAEQGGKNFAVMHVQTDDESKIETFAESITFNQFTLLGYWIKGQYVEVSGILNVTSANTWQGRDLTAFGVPAGAVTEILLGNRITTAERSIGVRASGSTLERRFNIHEAEDAGVDNLTLFTNTTSGSTNIEIYSQSVSDVDFVLLGYWSESPMAQFTETLIDIGEATSDATWEPKDLSLLLPLNINLSSVLEVVVGSDEGGAERELGIRQSGSTQNRILDLHEAEGGGLDFARMHVNIDGNKTVEIYEESAASVSDFIIAGYWQESPAPISSVDLFIKGRRPFPQLRSKKLYFTNQNGSIDRSDLDGTSWESMIDPSHTLAPVGPLGMSLDTIGRHVYWTETGRDLIVRMGLEIPNGETALNRSDVEILMSGVAGVGAPQGLDLHITSGIMFFTTLSPNVVVSGNMNIPSGETYSTRTDLVQVGTAITASKIIVDEIEDRYYVTETVFDTIQRATLSNPTRETIFDATGGFVFGGLGQDTVFGDVYFIDSISDDVQRLEQDGQGDVEVVFDSPSGELATTRAMFVDETEDQRKIYVSDSIDFIGRMNLDGTDFERIVENFVFPDFKTLVNPNELEVLQVPFVNDSLSLFIVAPVVKVSGLNLFIVGPELVSSDINLFTVGPEPISSGVDLFIVGPVPAISDVDLFIVGPVLATGAMTLAGLRPSGFTGELNLFVDKKDIISDTISLFMDVPDAASGEMTLFIVNSGVQVSFTGFMKGGPSLIEDEIPLFIRGTSDVDPIFFKDASMELYLKTIGDPTDSPTTFDTSVFLKVASGFLDTNTNWGLFLKSSTRFSIDLDMSITGTLGGTLVSGDMALYIQSFVDKTDWPLFLKTKPGTQDSLALFMSGIVADPIIISASSTLFVSGIAIPTAEMDLFLFNTPPSASSSMTMFLATTPLIGEESLTLYLHGF